MNTIVDYLDHWVAVQPEKRFSSFLDVSGQVSDTYTYRTFYERSLHLAGHLSQHVGLRHGERVLLAYPAGLEMFTAFVACVRIGVIPVPVPPPASVNFEAGLAKLIYIARDCDARVALTTRGLHRSYRAFLDRVGYSPRTVNAPPLPDLRWVTTDEVRGQASESYYDPNPILFLQYTSGSTSDPKGVIVSHENVIHNCHVTTDHVPTAVCWLPQYHDMGLIGYYVYLVITGGTTYGFSPTDFLKRPILWLEALSRFRATYTSAPNFGFEYCLREDKIASDQLADLDLSAVRVLMNASEPVRPETYRRFLERFAPCGLKHEAAVVAYGLAENTLAVTHYGRRIVTVDKRLLQAGRPNIESVESSDDTRASLVSCGRPLEGIQVRIVDPESRSALESEQIGEIWVAGKSTCGGYWNRPELTHQVFHNSIENDPEDHNLYLRTGDLGFLQGGELFVCGRMKDLIIVRGINYYPQDIERIVESVSDKIRAGSIAAFGGSDEEEMLIVAVEVRARDEFPDPADISRALRTQYYNGPHTIVFVPPRTIARTTSGKIAHSITRQRWLNRELPTIAVHVHSADQEISREFSSGLKERLQYILEPFNLTGHEEYTLAEIGIDSLTLVLLLLDIEQLLKEHGAADLVSDVDGRFLQRLTVAEFSGILDQLQNGSTEPIATLRSVVTQVRQENDDYEKERMCSDAKLGAINCANLPGNQEPLTNVLLTGPTGFLGPFLLSSLLQRTPYTYYLLTRATDRVRAIERIRNSLKAARLWTPTLEDRLDKRVHVVCGDIAQPDLGMGSELWERLITKIHAVVHSAALVNYVLSYDTLRPHNVSGTRELLRFCCTGRRKELHLISSTIIFGWTSKVELLEADNNDDMENLDFGYAQTKWVAEQLAFAAEKQGLKVRVYRPSFISASRDGIASQDDIVIRLLTFMIKHGIAVNALNQISFLPVDIVADNIAAIFGCRDVPYHTLHLTVDDYYNLPDITRLITEEYGYEFVYYDIPDFVAELRRRCPKDDLLYPLLDFFNRSHPKIAAMQHKRYNNVRYRDARRMAGISRPDPTLRETVSYLMEYMLRVRSIPERSGKLAVSG